MQEAMLALKYMTSNIDSYFEWLAGNSFWNSELLEVRDSDTAGGKGVFWKNPHDLDPSFVSSILLRVPKSNILSSKNSAIYNLLVDYNDARSEQTEIDLSSGMHGLIICFVYELSMGAASPWFGYLKAIDPANSPPGAPLCLWSEKERQMLHNTECYYADMMNLDELVLLFEECIKFGQSNAQYVEIPEILDVSLALKEEEAFRKYKSHLERFGACVQAVISRAFQVDDFHGPSLVPGADLFNHLSPEEIGGVVRARENVHFVCDGGENVCVSCGEQDCDHEDDDEEHAEEAQEEDEGISTDDSDEEDDEEESGAEEDGVENSGAEEGEESEQENEHYHKHNHNEQDNITEITMDLIEKIEREQKAEDEAEDEAENEPIDEDLSDREENTEQFTKIPYRDELEAQLLDSSQCVDIVMVSLPQKQYKYEVFNTYGNELSNPYLLQRYLFVVPNNVNDRCTMGVFMKEYVKQHKSKLSRGHAQQLDQKLEWLEEQFEIVCEVINEHVRQLSDMQKGTSAESDDDNDDEEDDSEGDFPDSWASSVRINYDGTFSPHTFLIFELLKMPFAQFKAKFMKTNSPRKLFVRVSKLLLGSGTENFDEEAKKTVKTWIHKRLAGYKELTAAQNHREHMIHQLVKAEKAILQTALAQL